MLWCPWRGFWKHSPSHTNAAAPRSPARDTKAYTPPRQTVVPACTTTIKENSALKKKLAFSPNQPIFSPKTLHLPLTGHTGLRASNPGRFRSTVNTIPTAITTTSRGSIQRRLYKGLRPRTYSTPSPTRYAAPNGSTKNI